MQIFEPAFLCCEQDIDDIFSAIATTTPSGNSRVITAQSMLDHYRRYNPNISEEQVFRGYKKLVDGFCGGSGAEDGITREAFLSAIEQFSTRIAAKGRGEDIVMDIGRVCVDMSDGNAVTFQRMMKLPHTLKSDEVEELMKFLKT